MLLLHTLFLVQRTVLSVMVARLDGRIVRDLVKADDKKAFARGIMWWFILALPSTYTNAMVRHRSSLSSLKTRGLTPSPPEQIVYLQSKIALAFRTRLTRYTHDLYLSERQNFYKFGLGLGALAATPGGQGGGADDRKGTGVGGGADQ